MNFNLKQCLFHTMFENPTIYLTYLKWFQYDYPKTEFFNYGGCIRNSIKSDERKIVIYDSHINSQEIEFYLSKIYIDDKDISIKFVLNNYTDFKTDFSFIFTKMTMDFQLESFDNYQEIESTLLL